MSRGSLRVVGLILVLLLMAVLGYGFYLRVGVDQGEMLLTDTSSGGEVHVSRSRGSNAASELIA